MQASRRALRLEADAIRRLAIDCLAMRGPIGWLDLILYLPLLLALDLYVLCRFGPSALAKMLAHIRKDNRVLRRTACQ